MLDLAPSFKYAAADPTLSPSSLYNFVWPMTLCIQPIPISQLSTGHSIVHPLKPGGVGTAQHRHTTSHQIHLRADETLPTWWVKVFSCYQVRKHVIYGLLVPFLFNGSSLAYWKTFLFCNICLDLIKLACFRNQIIGTGKDLKEKNV